MDPDDKQRQKTIKRLRNARDVLAEMGDDHRVIAPLELSRLHEVLDYAEQAIGRTRTPLVPGDAWKQVNASLKAISDETSANPEAFLTNRAGAVTDEISGQLSRFPATHNRLEEQEIAEAMALIRSEAAKRIDALRGELDEVSTQVTNLGDELKSQDSDLRETIAKRTEELQQGVSGVESELADERQRIEKTTTEQAETFRQSQEERDKQFKEHLSSIDEQGQRLIEETNERATALLAEIEEMRDRSARLVGSIGVTGTAERYRDEAESQRGAADRWRLIAVVGGGFAVAVAMYAAITVGTSGTDILPFLGKLAIGVALGGLATYSAKQSGRHRDREETARSVQLDLAAFNAFVEPLPEPMQAEERVALGRRIFGQHFAGQELKDGEIGPAAFQQIAELLRQGGGNRSDSGS